MKKILFVLLLACSTQSFAAKYGVVCRWADGQKDLYNPSEIDFAVINDGGTTVNLVGGVQVKYAPSVQCKMEKK